MRRLLLIPLGLLCPPVALAATLGLSAARIDGPQWQAQGLELSFDPHGAAQLRVERATVSGFPGVITAIRIDCPSVVPPPAIHCEQGSLSARIPGLGLVSGGLRATYTNAGSWNLATARLGTALGPLSLQLKQGGQDLQGGLQSPGLDLSKLAAALSAWGMHQRFSIAGRAGLDLQALLRPGQRLSARYRLQLSGLTLSEPSGQRASDKLAVNIDGTLSRDDQATRVQAQFALPQGQLYWEPVFGDFGAHPLQGSADLSWHPGSGRIELGRLSFNHAGVAEGELSGTLETARPATSATLEIKSLTARFPGFFDTYLKPFLAGKPYESLQTGGSAVLSASLRQGQPQQLVLALQEISLDSQRLGLALQGLNGRIAWSVSGAPQDSQLDWRAARFGKLPLAASGLRFRSSGRSFELGVAFRQPVLDGALRIGHFALQHIGEPELAAQFEADIEPISLDQLCSALGWPVFSGKLSGHLPGLSLQDRVLLLDGVLGAEAFDGHVTVSGLRIRDPFGPLPEMAADLRLRGLDLAELTGAFSFGRIEGRLDGDVDALRLLAWQPVAFKASIHTPAGDPSRHRISQRAIDNISSIGNGPSGLLSRGFMGLFKDFDYDRIGWSCELANGVCHMDGLGPAPRDGYYLVAGRWLPRIDVIGYSREVSWEGLLSQIDNVRHAQKPEVR